MASRLVAGAVLVGLVCLSVHLVGHAGATSPELGNASEFSTWSQKYEGDHFYGGAISDSGYLLVGEHQGNGWVVKTNHSGGVQWRREIGTAGTTRFNDAVALPGGGFVVAGDAGAVRLSADGSTEWSEGVHEATFQDVEVTSNGAILAVGGRVVILDRETGTRRSTWHEPSAAMDAEPLETDDGFAFVAKQDRPQVVITDANGSVRTQRRYGGPEDVLWGIDRRDNGGFVLSGIDYVSRVGNGWGILTRPDLSMRWRSTPATVSLAAVAGPNGTILIGSTGTNDVRWMRRNRTIARFPFNNAVWGIERTDRRVLVVGWEGVSGATAAVVDRRPPKLDFSAESVSTDHGTAKIEFRVGPGRNLSVFEWDFDADGSVDATVNEPTVEHVFERAGTHTVRLQAADSVGVRVEERMSVTVADETPPRVRLTSPANGLVAAGRVTRILANASSDNRNITRFRWDVGADGEIEAVTRDPVFRYGFGAPNRTVPLRLGVVDGSGNWNSTVFDLRTVPNDRPRITDVPTSVYGSGETTLEVGYENHVGRTNVTWRFPDGTIAYGDRVRYAFPESGRNYTVTLTVRDEYGSQESRHVEISVTEFTGHAVGAGILILVVLYYLPVILVIVVVLGGVWVLVRWT